MTNEFRNPNDERGVAVLFRPSGFVINSSFVIRASSLLPASASLFPPGFRLRRDHPRHRLLDAVAPAHPNIFGPIKNGREHFRVIEVLVSRNFMQHPNHSLEISPHHDAAKHTVWRHGLAEHAFEISGARWTVPTLLPCLAALTKKIFTGTAGHTRASQNAPKQVRSAPLNRANDVRRCRFHSLHDAASCWQVFKSSLPEARTGMASTRQIFFGIQRFGTPASRSLSRSWLRSTSTALSKTSASPLASSCTPTMAMARSSRPARSRRSIIFDSTDSCGTISPPIFEKRDKRPSMNRKPSSSNRPMSPVLNQPSRKTSVVRFWSCR